jgi:hypothetical protein
MAAELTSALRFSKPLMRRKKTETCNCLGLVLMGKRFGYLLRRAEYRNAKPPNAKSDRVEGSGITAAIISAS